ncbi:MAG: membrane or secreted protein [Cyclobacteriaceae bacterium]
MKKIFTALTICAIGFTNAQSLVGGWEMITKEDGKEIKMSVIFSDKYQVGTWFDNTTGEFISTNGGTWSLNGKTLTETVEFDTRDSTRVGTSVSFDIEWSDTELKIVDSDVVLTRTDAGKPGSLGGAWLMSGRIRNGEMQERSTDRPRKTMKILSGTRFQWIAYNTRTKQFMGTGGGSYTTVDGKYTENIEFFSRDNSRVGTALEFKYEMKDGKWHHSGNNSRGEPLYEVWSVRN